MNFVQKWIKHANIIFSYFYSNWHNFCSHCNVYVYVCMYWRTNKLLPPSPPLFSPCSSAVFDGHHFHHWRGWFLLSLYFKWNESPALTSVASQVICLMNGSLRISDKVSYNPSRTLISIIVLCNFSENIDHSTNWILILT